MTLSQSIWNTDPAPAMGMPCVLDSISQGSHDAFNRSRVLVSKSDSGTSSQVYRTIEWPSTPSQNRLIIGVQPTKGVADR